MDSELSLDPNKKWGMVAYTDGGARPNPGAVGSGIHAYIYELTEEAIPAKPLKFTDGEAIRYAFPSQTGYMYCTKDGTSNSTKSNEATPVKPEYILEMAASSSNQLTNNYAELNALFNAIKIARKYKLSKLHIVADSDYALNACVAWAAKWKINGWTRPDGQPIKNLDLIKLSHHEYLMAKEEGIIISGNWVKGHLHPGNMEADDLATIGVMKSKKGIDDDILHVFSFKEYQEPKRDRHPLMSLKRMYFNRERERNIPGTYMMADPGKEDHLVGKPLPEAVYAVVRMNEPIPLIESVLEAQYQHGQDFNTVMMIKMENLYVPDHFRMISTYGEHCMIRADRMSGMKGTNVVLPNRQPMTIERHPIGITMRAVDSINHLEGILDQYIDLRDLKENEFLPNNNDLKIHDVTSSFYDEVEKKVGKTVTIKKVLSKDITQTQKTLGITLDIGEGAQTLPLKLGLDILDRNALKRLETSDPIVHVITWRDSSSSFRYASVLTCNEGIAIWSNYYADRLFLKKK